MADLAGYIVVDLWRVKPGMQDQLDQVLAAAAERFRQYEEILSLDYARLDNDTSVYLVVFRYVDRAARERFTQSDDLKSTMSTLRQLWDLESPIYKGVSTGY